MPIAEPMVSAWSPVPSALEGLPMVRPPRVDGKVQAVVSNAPVKSADVGSMRSAPEPMKAPVSGLGASLLSTRVPPEMVELPL